MAAATTVKRTGTTKEPPWRWPRAAYLHVPFCAHHCCYCDFAVLAGKDQLIGRYLDALEKEVASLGSPQEVDSVFLGGGTPTHLQPKEIERLMEIINCWLSLAAGGEFSVETNPATLTEEKIQLLAGHGVNRVSLGAQSFQSHLLRFLERDHDAGIIQRALAAARPWIPQLSLDLIFGVPGQTLGQWRDDLQHAIDLDVSHISTYGLTYEKGTPLWKRRQKNEVQPIAEELERDMYAQAMDQLEAAGFEQYEISNFARPGHRSRHNQVYWANEAYFGFGLGAARYVKGRREVNTRDVAAYIDRIQAGQTAVQQAEELETVERARETAAVQLRRTEGIERRRFLEQTGLDLDALFRPVIEKNVQRGLLADDGESVFLTREGKFLADMVCQDVFRQ